MNPHLKELALEMLRSDGQEGVRRHAYDDATGKRVRAPEGNLTIGCGINLDQGLDDYEVDMLERHRLHVNLVELEARLKGMHLANGVGMDMGALPDSVQLGLALMVFQLGPAKVCGFRHMLGCLSLRPPDWEGAARDALDSKWAEDQTPHRAEAVAKLFRKAAGGGHE